jgi:hypothetical protein
MMIQSAVAATLGLRTPNQPHSRFCKSLNRSNNVFLNQMLPFGNDWLSADYDFANRDA